MGGVARVIQFSRINKRNRLLDIDHFTIEFIRECFEHFYWMTESCWLDEQAIRLSATNELI